MVGLVKRLTHQIVALACKGSIPLSYPSLNKTLIKGFYFDFFYDLWYNIQRFGGIMKNEYYIANGKYCTTADDNGEITLFSRDNDTDEFGRYIQLINELEAATNERRMILNRIGYLSSWKPIIKEIKDGLPGICPIWLIICLVAVLVSMMGGISVAIAAVTGAIFGTGITLAAISMIAASTRIINFIEKRKHKKHLPKVAAKIEDLKEQLEREKGSIKVKKVIEPPVIDSDTAEQSRTILSENPELAKYISVRNQLLLSLITAQELESEGIKVHEGVQKTLGIYGGKK